MNKREIKLVVDEVRMGKMYEKVSIDSLDGCAYFQEKKKIRKEVIVQFLRWQALNLDGSINDEMLTEAVDCLSKNIIMI